MNYLKRDGSITNVYPDEIEQDDLEMSVETRFEALVYNEQGAVVAIEIFNSYPSIGSIKWCLLRHRKEAPVKISVKKVYVPTWD